VWVWRDCRCVACHGHRGQHDWTCGRNDLAGGAAVALGRVRRAGGGCKPLAVTDPDSLAALMALV
jgi:hypothetical protein